MVATGKGLLAADESTGTIKKRFDAIGVENTEDNRRDYREMLFRTTTAMKEHISGVILFDETIRQKAKDGTPLVDADRGRRRGARHQGRCRRQAAGAGARARPSPKAWTACASASQEYHKLGARFAKWRARDRHRPTACPTYNCINANAQALARYAALAQENGIVPIVEPEVLMDGDHDIAALRGRHRMGAEGSVRAALLRRRGAGRHDPEAQHDRAGQEVRQAGQRRRSRRAHREGAEAPCAVAPCRASPSCRAASRTKTPPRIWTP